MHWQSEPTGVLLPCQSYTQQAAGQLNFKAGLLFTRGFWYKVELQSARRFAGKDVRVKRV